MGDNDRQLLGGLLGVPGRQAGRLWLIQGQMMMSTPSAAGSCQGKGGATEARLQCDDTGGWDATGVLSCLAVLALPELLFVLLEPCWYRCCQILLLLSLLPPLLPCIRDGRGRAGTTVQKDDEALQINIGMCG